MLHILSVNDFTDDFLYSLWSDASKRKGKKRNNIVPFKQDLQVISNDNPVSARQAEIDKINHHAREVFTKLGEFADSCKISVDEVWYNILYFAKHK